MFEGFSVGVKVGVSEGGELDGLLLGLMTGKELGMRDVVLESRIDADSGVVDGISVLIVASSTIICDFEG